MPVDISRSSLSLPFSQYPSSFLLRLSLPLFFAFLKRNLKLPSERYLSFLLSKLPTATERFPLVQTLFYKRPIPTYTYLHIPIYLPIYLHMYVKNFLNNGWLYMTYFCRSYCHKYIEKRSSGWNNVEKCAFLV